MKNHLAFAGLLVAGLLAAQEKPAEPAVPANPARPAEQFLSIPTPGRFRNFFLPFRTDTAALSPDGKLIAYSVREGEKLSVAVIEADHPEKIKTAVFVGKDDASTPMLSANQAESTPARIKWMRWATPTRLVLETNQVFATHNSGTDSWESSRGAVYAFDADGANARLLVQPRDIPLSQRLDRMGIPGTPDPFRTQGATLTGNPFALVERSLSTPIKGTWQPSDPMPGTINNEIFGLAAPVDPTQSLEPTAELSSTVTNLAPLTLQVFDLDARRPGNVTLVVVSGAPDDGAQRLDYFSLDTAKGRLTSLDYDFVNKSRSSLLDRQGHIRLTLPNSQLTKFPFRYAYRGPAGAGRDRPLNDTVRLADFSVSPENFFSVRAIPLGFDDNPDVLYYADNTGRDTYGIYSLNLATGQRGSLAMENPAYDLVGAPMSGFSLNRALVFDRYDHRLAGVRYDNALRSTAWLKPELKGLQAYLEQNFPGRSVEITDWDESHRRFLVATEGPADAGAFYFFDSEGKRLVEFARRAPWIDAAHTHPTLPFSFTAADGTLLSGLVTVPKQPHLEPIPMIVLCPTWPWQRVNSDFSTEVQALTDMGFVVMQLNGRGAWGLGLKHRQTLTAGYDEVQVEDLAASIGRLQQVFRINPARVALLGFGHGGFIALRTLQAHPDKFRCAIALDAPVDLGAWVRLQEWDTNDQQATLMKGWLGDAARFQAAPLVRHPEAVRKPVLMLNYPGPAGAQRTPTYLAASSFARAVGRAGVPAQFAQLSTDYVRGLPQARAEVFGRIEEFLNVNVYDFNVKLHELKIVDH